MAQPEAYGVFGVHSQASLLPAEPQHKTGNIGY